MADAASSPVTTLDSNSQPDNPNPQSTQPDPAPASAAPPPPSSSSLSSTPVPINPNSNQPIVTLPPPPSISYAVPGAVPPAAPSFRPVVQFSTMTNPGMPYPNYQRAVGVLPPGMSSESPMAPGSVPQQMMHYQMQPMRTYQTTPNGYAAMPAGASVS